MNPQLASILRAIQSQVQPFQSSRTGRFPIHPDLLLCFMGAIFSRHPRQSPLVPTGKDGAFPFVPTLGKLAMQVQ